MRVRYVVVGPIKTLNPETHVAPVVDPVQRRDAEYRIQKRERLCSLVLNRILKFLPYCIVTGILKTDSVPNQGAVADLCGGMRIRSRGYHSWIKGAVGILQLLLLQPIIIGGVRFTCAAVDECADGESGVDIYATIMLPA